METKTISAEAQSEIVKSLETLLADSYSLMAQTHLAHWNVEGNDFFALHEAFQQQYEELFAAVDDIAERIRALGSYSPGGLKMLAGMTEIGGMERRQTAKDFVANLIDFHEQLVASAQKGRDLAGDSGDPETEDLFIERLRSHEKTLWMLKSHLKK